MEPRQSTLSRAWNIGETHYSSGPLAPSFCLALTQSGMQHRSEWTEFWRRTHEIQSATDHFFVAIASWYVRLIATGTHPSNARIACSSPLVMEFRKSSTLTFFFVSSGLDPVTNKPNGAQVSFARENEGAGRS